MRRFLLILSMSMLSFASCDTAKLLFAEPTESEVVYALQKILDSSALRAISTISDLNKNGVEAILPEELRPVLSVIKTTGAIEDIDKIEAKIGEISQEVTIETGELLRDAVKELSFGDGVAVLLGGKQAATQVLKNAMYKSAKKRYSSKIENELVQLEPEIMSYWAAGSSAYNLFAENKVDSSLPDFIAERSVDLLFGSIGKEEAYIREQPHQLGDIVVSKVFDYYKNQQKITF